MKHSALPACLAASLGVAACNEASAPSSGSGQLSLGSNTDLTSFEGPRAGQAELGLVNLGYEVLRSEGLTNYWFNKDTGACAAITTSEGRYSSVEMLPPDVC